MTICYLDVDDEITNAVARLRAAQDLRVLLVLPPGSRIATSRINFRLLAREAREHARLLSIVSGEPGVRQVAVSAGLPAYGSVAEFEQAQEARQGNGEDAEDAGERAYERGRDAGDGGRGVTDEGVGEGQDGPDEPAGGAGFWDDDEAAIAAGGGALAGLSAAELSGRGSGMVGPQARPEAGTATRRQLEAQRRDALRQAQARPLARPTAAAPAAHAAPARESLEAPAVRRRERTAADPAARRTLVAAGLAALALLVVLGGVGAYLVLPKADITITPRAERAGPITLTVRADPAVTEPDSTSGVVPATAVEIPLSVNGEFPATGVEVSTTQATGSVRFLNKDPSAPNTVAAGSIVATDSDVRFATLAEVVVPRARIQGFTIIPGRANADVRAVAGGPEGNVAPNAIHNVPASENPELLSVTNQEATTGGTRTEALFVQKNDYDGAVAALSARLGGALTSALADPDTTPAGLMLFPDTAVRGRATAEPAPAQLVGQKVERFVLTLSATAAATAVDEGQLDALATERLKTSVPEGWQLFVDSVRGRHEPGQVDGRTVVYRVEAEGEQWRPVAAERLLDEVKGMTKADAQSRLEQHGRVTIETWPDWVGTIPTLDARLSLTIAAPERLP